MSFVRTMVGKLDPRRTSGGEPSPSRPPSLVRGVSSRCRMQDMDDANPTPPTKDADDANPAPPTKVTLRVAVAPQ
eukprot:3563600-Prymnesium_polylepis.1